MTLKQSKAKKPLLKRKHKNLLQTFALDRTFTEESETYSAILWTLTVMLNCFIHLFHHNCTGKKTVLTTNRWNTDIFEAKIYYMY